MLAEELQLRLTRIGSITAQPGLILLNARNQPMSIEETGFDHFA